VWLIREYAKGQKRALAEEKLIAAMRWSDPEQDVLRVRKIASAILYFDIDHDRAWMPPTLRARLPEPAQFEDHHAGQTVKNAA